MNRYHWFVLIVAALGWLFDCLDQQLFNLARDGAMEDLLKSKAKALLQRRWVASRMLVPWMSRFQRRCAMR